MSIRLSINFLLEWRFLIWDRCETTGIVPCWPEDVALLLLRFYVLGGM